MTPQLHASAVENIASSYRERGYAVDIEPSGPSLPAFLQGFRPDLIATRPGDSVVVEVKVGTRTSVAERLRDVAERVSHQPGWRFSVVFADPDQPGRVIEGRAVPLPLVEQRVREGQSLVEAGRGEAAFLLLWSAVESALRVLGEQGHLPLASLPASALIGELYSAGELDHSDFTALMRLLPLRNQLAHGFDPQGVLDAARELSVIAGTLLDEIRNPAPAD